MEITNHSVQTPHLRRDSYLFANFLLFPHFHQQKLVVVHLNPAILAMFWNVLALESVEGGVVGFWECVASLLIKVVTSFSPAQFVAE